MSEPGLNRLREFNLTVSTRGVNMARSMHSKCDRSCTAESESPLTTKLSSRAHMFSLSCVQVGHTHSVLVSRGVASEGDGHAAKRELLIRTLSMRPLVFGKLHIQYRAFPPDLHVQLKISKQHNTPPK